MTCNSWPCGYDSIK